MCVGGGGTPDPPPLPPVLPEAPDASKRVTVAKDGDDERRRRAGRAGTILTGSRGLVAGAGGITQDNTLLGG